MSSEKTKNIRIYSKGRKTDEYMYPQKNSGGKLYVDGRFVKKTRKDHIYVFHLVNGKIDHFYEVAFPYGYPSMGVHASDAPFPEECPACKLAEGVYYVKK